MDWIIQPLSGFAEMVAPAEDTCTGGAELRVCKCTGGLLVCQCGGGLVKTT